jgi:hypothetical protein
MRNVLVGETGTRRKRVLARGVQTATPRNRGRVPLPDARNRKNHPPISEKTLNSINQ